MRAFLQGERTLPVLDRTMAIGEVDLLIISQTVKLGDPALNPTENTSVLQECRFALPTVAIIKKRSSSRVSCRPSYKISVWN